MLLVLPVLAVGLVPSVRGPWPCSPPAADEALLLRLLQQLQVALVQGKSRSPASATHDFHEGKHGIEEVSYPAKAGEGHCLHLGDAVAEQAHSRTDEAVHSHHSGCND